MTHNHKEGSHVLPGQFRPMADDYHAASVPCEQASGHGLGAVELRHGAGPLRCPDRGESLVGEGDETQGADCAAATACMVLRLAPELLDVEVLSVLRRAVLRQQLEEQRAWLAFEDLLAWPIDRITHTALIREAWQHRHNVSAYDAFYVAAARVYDASLLTADGPLARARALGIVVQNIRMA